MSFIKLEPNLCTTYKLKDEIERQTEMAASIKQYHYFKI